MLLPCCLQVWFAATMPDASGPLLAQLATTLEKDEGQRKELIGKIKVGRQKSRALVKLGFLDTKHARLSCYRFATCMPFLGAAAESRRWVKEPTMPSTRCLLLQGIVLFVIDGEKWTLDLREGKVGRVQWQRGKAGCRLGQGRTARWAVLPRFAVPCHAMRVQCFMRASPMPARTGQPDQGGASRRR